MRLLILLIFFSIQSHALTYKSDGTVLDKEGNIISDTNEQFEETPLAANQLDQARKMIGFNQWLFDNGFNQFLESDGKPKSKICDNARENSQIWNYNNCGGFTGTNNLDIKIYTERGDEIPHRARPNKDSLLFYAWHYIDQGENFRTKKISPSKSPYEFQFNLIKDKDISDEINNSPLLSYLMFKNDKIIIDEVSPKDRFGIVFNDETNWTSHSVGKSIVSYIAGHAICEGYIESTETTLGDWEVLNDTLYANVKLIDLLNMNAGDHKYVTEEKGLIKTGRWFNQHGIKSYAENELKGSQKSKNKYNYHGLATNIIFNYVAHKAGKNFKDLLKDIWQNKVKIKNEVWITTPDEDSFSYRYAHLLTRYDYLRFARAILEDWQNNTCVGDYLKTIYDQRINKNNDEIAKEYGGQFHFNYPGLSSLNILGMQGFGGQQILIDLDNSTIIVINSVHYGYDDKKIVTKKLKSYKNY